MLQFLFIVAIATNSAGQNGVTSYPLPTTGSNFFRNCLKIDAAGNKWVGFRNIGLGKFDGTTWTMFDTLNSNIPANAVNDVAFDASNTMWVATINGLAKYDGATWTTYTTINSGLPSDSISCLFVHNSEIWIGTNKGLVKYNAGVWTVYNTSNSGLSTNTIQCINIESNNDVWVGTKIGLLKKSGNTWINYANINPYYTASYSILCIYIDANNDKWLGTNYGALKLVGSNLTSINSLFTSYAINNYKTVYSITKGVHGGIVFKGVSDLIEISGNQIYKYLNIGSDLNVLDDNSKLIWSINKSNSLLYSFNYLNYPSNALLDPISKGVNVLDINEVRADILDRGDLFWGVYTNHLSGYEVPKNTGRNSNFASALWMGGLDNGGALHVAAMTYRQNGNDFWPGPLDTINGTIDSVTSDKYDKIWKIDRVKIEEFKYMFSIGAVQSGAYTPQNDIITWPAIGTGNFTRKLAPFVDVNHDGLYNPLTDGDYPDIKGDQMCYWIFNDNLHPHTETGGAALKVEIHASAYAYTCPTITDSLIALNYTTFYSYKIFNRSTNDYHNTSLGFWEDIDIGYYLDDYVGCNPKNNYGFVYNGDSNDGSGEPTAYGIKPPMLSTVILNGPMAEPNDGIDNNNNGTIDEVGEKNLMTNFLSYNNSNNPINGNPSGAIQYYNFMNSRFSDGTHLTYGGNGIGGSIPYNFIYDGIPAGTGWDESSSGDLPDDRRFLIGCGPFNLNAGQNVDFDFALVFTRDTVSNYTIQNLYQKNKEDVNRVQKWYAVDNFPSCLNLNIGINEEIKNKTEELFIYPNPANNNITVVYKTTSKKYTINIYDATGRIVKTNEIKNSDETIVNINDLKDGIYLINVKDGKNYLTKRFVKQ